MRCNFVVCRSNEKGQEEYLESFIRMTWTDVLYHGVSFRELSFADDLAGFLSNQLDQHVYARPRAKEGDR